MSQAVKNSVKKHKWGEIRESDGKVFWGYKHKRKDPRNPSQKYEEWVDPEIFKKRREKSREETKKRQQLPESKAKRRISDKIYYSNSEKRQQRRDWWSKYTKERKSRDPEFGIRLRIRTRICMALKGAGVKKSVKTQDLIGCSYAELRTHIESQFREGMAWDKPHSFHIDHIRPLCSFDLSDPEQLKMACHWTNLQPLYPHENYSKSGKFIEVPRNEPVRL